MRGPVIAYLFNFIPVSLKEELPCKVKSANY
jgi:hypothetical protein